MTDIADPTAESAARSLLLPCPCGKHPKVSEDDSYGSCNVWCDCEPEPCIQRPVGKLDEACAAWNKWAGAAREPDALITFCPECGPNVSVDEDGACGMCGALAVGAWVERIRLASVPPSAALPAGRMFYLERDVDASGVSGTGRVAQGFEFEDGTCALRWLTTHRSTAVYSSLAELEAIHGHNGSTRIALATLQSPATQPSEEE